MAKTTAFFTATYEGFETVEEDVEKHRQKIEKISSDALSFLGTEMTKTLQKHIREDWYEPWGPPKAYPRRTDNPSLGIPLGDNRNISAEQKGLSLIFTYKPSGDHAARKWYRKSGDALIEVIQENKGWSFQPKFDRNGHAIMPRPFWDRFVEEEKNGGIWSAFQYGFGGHGYNLIPEGNGLDVEFAPGEGMLGNQMSMA